MKPLIVLLVTFISALAVLKLRSKRYEVALSARIAMSLMLIFTAIGHFTLTKGMAMMVPDFIPYKREVVYLTGAIEILAAVGLLISSLRKMTAWLLIIFFILILPANVYAAIHHIDYEKGTFQGPGVNYLWFRVPLQMLFIVWVYFSSIKSHPEKPL